jgi:hypothetical protein
MRQNLRIGLTPVQKIVVGVKVKCMMALLVVEALPAEFSFADVVPLFCI